MKILIQWPAGQAMAELRDTASTGCLVEVLPLQSVANTWGKEVYFEIPVNAGLEDDAMQVVEPGTVGFWTEGNCLVLAFGPTPISVAEECRLAARVNILGRLEGDPGVLDSVQAGDLVSVSPCPEP